MGEMRKVEAMLDSGTADDITEAVSNGSYTDAGALLGEAMALWRSFRDREQSELQDLRETIAEVIARNKWLEGNFSLAEIRADNGYHSAVADDR